MTISWRPLTEDAVAGWAETVNLLAEADGTEEFYAAEDLLEELRDPGFDPARDSLAAWQDGELLGYVVLWTSGTVGSDGRAWVGIEGGVRPAARGRGIGRQLMDRMEPRACRLAAERYPGVEVNLRASGGLAGASVRPMLEHRGFELVRHFHELERPLTDELPEPPVGVRPFTAELAEAVRLAHNEAFAGHWGSSPRTEQNWQQVMESRTFRPECSFVAVAEDGLVDAYSIARQWMPDELHVDLVGTRVRARGRGLARACLAGALRAGAERGLARIGLAVDSENASGAGRLYESMGFRPVRVTGVYRKAVGSAVPGLTPSPAG